MNVLVGALNMAVVAGVSLTHHHVTAIRLEHADRGSVQGGEGLTGHDLFHRADRETTIRQVENAIHMLNDGVDFMGHEHHRHAALTVEPVNQLSHRVLVVEVQGE